MPHGYDTAVAPAETASHHLFQRHLDRASMGCCHVRHGAHHRGRSAGIDPNRSVPVRVIEGTCERDCDVSVDAPTPIVGGEREADATLTELVEMKQVVRATSTVEEGGPDPSFLEGLGERPRARLAGRHVVIVDDILDEGHTLAAILAAIKAQGAASVRTAMLLLKDHDRRANGVHADYVGCHVADRYVFGAGMDYKGYYRQLPGVWAIGQPGASGEPCR